MVEDKYEAAESATEAAASEDAAAEKVEPIKDPQGAPLNRADILAADDSHVQRVRVPEWGGFIYMRAISSKERDIFDVWGVENVGVNVRARLVSMAVSDEAGNKLFSDEDLVALGEKNSRILDRLFDIACKMNGIGLQELQALEEN